MKIRRSLGIFLTLLILLIGWFGLSISRGGVSEEDEVVKIGAILSLSNASSSFYGEYAKRSIDLVQAEPGMFGSKKLQIFYEDSQGDSAKALLATNKLLEQGVRLFVSDISSVSLAIAPVIQERGGVLMAVASSTPKLSGLGDGIFRTKVPAFVESKEMSNYVKERGLKSVAMLYQNSDYGIGVNNSLKSDLVDLGVPILYSEAYNTGTTDFRSYLFALKAYDVGVLVLAGFPKEIGIMVKQIKEAGLNLKILIHSGSVGPDIDLVAGTLAEDLTYLTELDSRSTNLEFASFAAKYKERYGELPELISSTSYDGVRLLLNAVADCSTVEGGTSCVKKWLKNVNMYPGASGLIKFDDQGDIVNRDFICMRKIVDKNKQRLVDVICTGEDVD